MLYIYNPSSPDTYDVVLSQQAAGREQHLDQTATLGRFLLSGIASLTGVDVDRIDKKGFIPCRNYFHKD
ncbi:hypothetical protein XYCOK13_00760 [Xylanibacillus composti]|uniref:Uncharacterized protein n=1 Tax=Xylanibacillus composti TaxID=1572762 RepID=A0A8J4M0X2_9BACL|nr:hypothetical protein XYCOK13_00760 [Xylanibacillus composti]